MIPASSIYGFPNLTQTLPNIPQMNAFPRQCVPYLPTIFDPSFWNVRNMSQEQIMRLAQIHQRMTYGPMVYSNVAKEEFIDAASTPATQITLDSPVKRPVLSTNSSPQLESQIAFMIQFFVDNYGRTTEFDIQRERAMYNQDQRLGKIFDILISKYASIIKTREQRIKWIIRRAFKTTKQAITKDKKAVSKDEVSKNMCKRYFKDSKEESPEQDDDDDCNYGDLLNSLLPFKKNSKNKTMNASFLTEIFESEQFRQDYKNFLNDFDNIIEKDIQEKVKRFASFVVDCVKKEKIDSIKKYKRVPWLKVWFQNTKKLAIDLADENLSGKPSKIIKKEE